MPFVVISIYCERFFIKKDTIKVNSKPNYSIDYDINRINIAKKACEDYTLEIALDPQNFNFHLERARIYESLKKYDLAVQDLTRAMQLDSQKSYFYYFLRHKQYIFLGDLEKALEDIKKAVNLAPYGCSYHRYLADVYEKFGQRDNAIMALNQGVEKEPKRKETYLQRANFYERIGRIEEALRDVTMAINIDPKYMITFHYRIRIYIKMEQFDNALADCKKCIEIEPKEWTHFRLLSEVYKAMGDNNAADVYYQHSVELNQCINR